MVRPFTVSLDLFRGAAYHPYARQSVRLLAEDPIEACAKAESSLNVALADNQYAAATEARPVWEPRPQPPAFALAA